MLFMKLSSERFSSNTESQVPISCSIFPSKRDRNKNNNEKDNDNNNGDDDDNDSD